MQKNGKTPFKEILIKIHNRLSTESPKNCIDIFNKTKNQLINHFDKIDKEMIEKFRNLNFFKFFNENKKFSKIIIYYLTSEKYEDLFAFIKLSKLLNIEENDDLLFLKTILSIKLEKSEIKKFIIITMEILNNF